jgi:hypothetical protein
VTSIYAVILWLYSRVNLWTHLQPVHTCTCERIIQLHFLINRWKTRSVTASAEVSRNTHWAIRMSWLNQRVIHVTYSKTAAVRQSSTIALACKMLVGWLRRGLSYLVEQYEVRCIRNFIQFRWLIFRSQSVISWLLCLLSFSQNILAYTQHDLVSLLDLPSDSTQQSSSSVFHIVHSSITVTSKCLLARIRVYKVALEAFNIDSILQR